MLPEIITENTKVTMKDVQDSWNEILKKNYFNSYGAGQYASAILHFDYNYDENPEFPKGYYKARVETGIRMMGTLDIEEMNIAAEEIKRAAKIAERFNDKLAGVRITR